MSKSPNPGIPRKAISTSTAVHRPADSDSNPASSSRAQYHSSSVVQQHSEECEESNPPPYSGPTTTLHSDQHAASIPLVRTTNLISLPPLNYSLYCPPHFTLSSDHTTISTHHALYSASPTALCSLFQELATVPPKPMIRIVGGGDELNPMVDFDIRLNCMNLFIAGNMEGQSQSNRGWHYVKVIGKREKGWRGGLKEDDGIGGETGEERDLKGWADAFCKDESSIKQFTLTRTIPNWSITHLTGLILSLISRTTDYRGHVSITFPVTHSKVTIHSPDKVNRFFSNVTKVFTGVKRYEVVKSVWPYATTPRGEAGRKCLVMDEEAWFNEWRDVIARAVGERRKGWVTVEDRLEFLMEPGRRRESER